MQENTGLLWFVAIVAVISMLCSGLALWAMPATPTFPTAQEIGLEVGKNIVVPQAPAAPVVNLSGVATKEDVAPLLADDNWKDEAVKIATNEWSAKDNKEIFKAVDDAYGNIVDKEDIVYVKVTDDNVRRADAEDKDARVVQEVKVRYESTGGDTVNKYFRITTEIKDGDVSDQSIIPYTP